ncbi:MAG: type IV pilus biogenesis/stability protein PilW [Proteobacteria bacterium]|nr:type IV pilus biogenesis/stability protein PilW [Pseudomonadota bacterium]
MSVDPRAAARRLLPLLLPALGVLGACTSTTQVVMPGMPGSNELPAEKRNPADPAEVERRAHLRLELAGMYFGRGQTDTALDELKAALAAKPEFPEAYGLRGLILASMGDAQGAEASFRRALQMRPGDADVLHNYGWFLCQQRRYDEADAQFRAALAQPQYRDAVRTLLAQGACQARAGRWADAEATLARSYELDPANPATAYNLAEVQLRRGELERARFYVQRINAVPEQVSAQSLWLAARIERRRGDRDALADLGRKLRDRFPQSAETLRFERGQFDD